MSAEEMFKDVDDHSAAHTGASAGETSLSLQRVVGASNNFLVSLTRWPAGPDARAPRRARLIFYMGNLPP